MNKPNKHSITTNHQELLQRQDLSKALLYEKLYKKSVIAIADLELSENETMDVFQNSFLVLWARIDQGKYSLSEKDPNMANAYLEKSFERIFLDQLFHIELSIYRLVLGIQKGFSRADERLATAVINNHDLKSYATKLVEWYPNPVMGSLDLLNDCCQVMLKTVRNGKFSLKADLDNGSNKKLFFKYFRELMFRKAYKKENRKSKEFAVEPEAFSDLVNETEGHEIIGEELSTLADIKKLFRSLDKRNQKVLGDYFLLAKKPKQIAKMFDEPEWNSTEKIRAQMTKSINWLGKQLVAKTNEMETKQIVEIANKFRDVIKAIEEPCRTILFHAFPPQSKSMEEIANILKETRPEDETKNLNTPTQIKRRKYKCNEVLKEKIWDAIINQQNSESHAKQ